MADDTYIFESVTADPDAIHAQNMERLAELLPDWTEQPTAIEVLASKARATSDAILLDFASDVLATIVAEVARVAGIDRALPAPLVGTVTVATDGLATRSLPAGSTMVAALPDQTPVTLITTTDTTIPADTTTVAGVPVQSVNDALYAGLSTPQDLELDQAFSWLEGVTLNAVTSLGSDGDDDDTYLARASTRLRNLADQLIRPENVAAFVADFQGVGRSLVLNLVDATNPAVPVSPVDRCLTVVVTGSDGSSASNGLITAVKNALQARREVNFKFFVVRPTYVPVDVELTVAVWPDELDTAEARVEEAVRAWLHPSTFGGRGYGYGDGGVGQWSNTSTVRVGEVVSVADAVEGVDYVDPSLVLIDGANADFDMDAPIAALPDPAATTVTVNVVERQP